MYARGTCRLATEKEFRLAKTFHRVLIDIKRSSRHKCTPVTLHSANVTFRKHFVPPDVMNEGGTKCVHTKKIDQNHCTPMQIGC